MKWNGNRKAFRLGLISQSNMTSFLPDDCISKLAKNAYEIFP
jgi:hypothetical protein